MKIKISIISGNRIYWHSGTEFTFYASIIASTHLPTSLYSVPHFKPRPGWNRGPKTMHIFCHELHIYINGIYTYMYCIYNLKIIGFVVFLVKQIWRIIIICTIQCTKNQRIYYIQLIHALAMVMSIFKVWPAFLWVISLLLCIHILYIVFNRYYYILQFGQWLLG